MSTGRYDAVFFDLFDTLVRFDRDRLPQIEIAGRRVRSTAGCLHALLQPHAPSVSLDQCYEALLASWQEAERRRAIDHRETMRDSLWRAPLDAELCTRNWISASASISRTEYFVRSASCCRLWVHLDHQRVDRI